MNQETKTQTNQITEPQTSNQKQTNQRLRIRLPANLGSWGLGSGSLVFPGRLVCGNESEWKEFLFSLSCSDLERLSKIRNEVYLAKFPSRRGKRNLSRNVYRVFSENDLVQFFSAIKPSEAKLGLAFFLQLTGGFRVGEVVCIKTSNVDFERGVISLITEKANVASDQPLPAVALEVLQEWIQTNGEYIRRKGDYLFFSNALFQERLCVDVNSLRNFFQKVRARAGLEQSYAEAADKNNPKQQINRPLYKLTTHSFRRTYGSQVYRESKKKEAVKSLLRHLKKDPTDCYIFFDHSEQLELVNKVFNREPYQTIARDLIEKIRAVRGEGK